MPARSLRSCRCSGAVVVPQALLYHHRTFEELFIDRSISSVNDPYKSEAALDPDATREAALCCGNAS
ncbi:hypothetical protein COCSUDRAFT_33990 [Coccomyxa subellipsoidea C-169]|uniref:Uncharacterized protein n=1 Tax=Coccomyxa subellipsoidea (strain C-169) TaxID=574566 RepID=I0YQ33_COCSC|nr:hypothetical protein COCSUDRAFT_33990 [Coccomyxa subellipsoidea C-169]EIE20502.1 hypothetical protein COCSUDRAFT_33990 [Coccomyxa subellipsoidea C-169]|eukprot:XP_005645046.1 hypothetical protein COCSUDRAFT_33990 [Coccomyxa subellipsoidea C-169]